jgi:hypothetical protein
MLDLKEPDDSPLAGERLGATRLVGSLAHLGLDAPEIAEVTGLDPGRVRAALDRAEP